MEPLEHLTHYLVQQHGVEATWQLISDAVHCNPNSKQAQELYAAFKAVREQRERKRQQQSWMESEMSRPWIL